MSTRPPTYVPPPAPSTPVPGVESVLRTVPPVAVPREDHFWPAAWLLWGVWLGVGGLIALGTDTAPDLRWALGWPLVGLCGLLGAGGVRGLLLDRTAREIAAAHAAQHVEAGEAIVASYRDYYAAQVAASAEYTAHVLGGAAPPKPKEEPPAQINRPPAAPPEVVDDEARKAIARMDAQIAEALAYVAAHPAAQTPEDQATRPLAADGLLSAQYFNGPCWRLVATALRGESISNRAMAGIMSDRAWRLATERLLGAGVLCGGGDRKPYKLTTAFGALSETEAHSRALALLAAAGVCATDLPGDLR